jgi:hypothetical protein
MTRTKIYRLGTGFILPTICFLGVVVTLNGDSRVVPPKEADAIGAWSGYSDHGEFVRLELGHARSGYISLGAGVGTPEQDFPTVYKVNNWRLSDFAITWEIRPLTGGAEQVTFDRVRCYYDSRECEFRGTNWNRRVKLLNERRWQTHTKKAKEAIAKGRKATK